MASSIRSALAEPGELSRTTRTMEAIRGDLSNLPFPADTMFDLMTRFISIQTLTDGAATAALMSIPAFPSYSPMVFYLSKESGAYRVVDATGDFSGIGRECLALVDAGRVDDARAWMRLVRTQHAKAAAFPDTTNDPLFSLLAADGTASADDVRLAAGFTLARSNSAADAKLGVSIVLPRWRAEKDSARRLTLETTLAEGLLTARMPELQEVAAGFVKDSPDNLAAVGLLCIAMEQAGKAADAEALVRSRIAAKPGDLGLSRLLEERLANAGRYADALTVAGSILDSGAAELQDYNSFAWYSLYTGVPDPAVVEKRQIVPRLVAGNSAELHTLACVLADAGRILEAQEVFGKYLDQRGGVLPEPSTWLAYGILAQRFGLIDTARGAFAKVTLDEQESLNPGTSSWALAQLHLKDVQPEKK